MTALAFHKLCPRFTWGVTNWKPDRFKRLIQWLVDQGYVLSNDDSLKQDIEITFDDGYAHLYDILPKLIDRFGFKPVVFVPTTFIAMSNKWDYSHMLQKMNHLDRAQIQSLAGMGVMFGSHGHTHRDMTSLNNDTIREELEYSRKILEDITGERVSQISYPFGAANQRVTDLAAESGYETGYTMRYPSKRDKPLTTGRIPVYALDNLLSIRWKLSSGPMNQLERTKSTIIHSFSAGSRLFSRFKNPAKID